eukprot:gnl/MRDRNA2_/MRDRNA2_32985_c0_seq1.p1 gnl/MRDRNA2_/MRDRNA2_32985_c0~~gnl/MRDRNA2_/MRDRNA2_32985_c0_seq1.p1  ORF type:complete len:588 (+),score=99.87 gnl/MRDRNA2_/MRDRNA2_32985_c0_seq1:120-1766(+)
MHLAITHDAAELADGYVALLEIVQIMGKLGVVITFILVENPDALGIIVLLPLVMLLFGFFRMGVLQRASEEVDEKEGEVLAVVNETCRTYRLVAEYYQRPQMNAVFKKKTNDLRKVEVPERSIKMNNNYFPKWLGPIFTCVYIFMQAGNVACWANKDGPLSLGTFLTTIHIFREISDDFSELYVVVMRITRRFDPLQIMAKYFNLDTDLKHWQETQSRRMQRMAETVQQHNIQPAYSGYTHDKHSIQIRNMGHRYVDPKHKGSSLTLFDGVNLEVPQGKLVAVVGPHGAGRATFLKLLGQAIFPPTTGEIFVPPHLRVLHVSQEPVLLLLSPWRNLTFGIPDLDDVEYVRNILKELEMPKMLEIVDEHVAGLANRHGGDMSARSLLSEDINEDINGHEEEETLKDEHHKFHHGWQEPLTYTEKVKTHIARAFIMNPEVMVLQRPLYHFGQKAAEQMLKHIKKHVDNRGLCLPESTAHKRRPRTVFFSPETKEQAEVADVIWQIDKEKKTVYETTADSLQDDFGFSGIGAPPRISAPGRPRVLLHRPLG